MSVPKFIQERGKILDEIMRHHRERLPQVKRDVPIADVRAMAAVAPPPLDFYAALKQPGVSLIAECKKASPSKGLIAPGYDAVALATAYANGGAAAISVLTDGRHFQGNLSHLRDAKDALERKQLDVPFLRKDFIFDEYQLYEARGAGADAVLLIAAVLSDNELADLLKRTHKLQMNALVEVHSEEELERVLAQGPRIVGINNRNLQTFEVDFENTARLRKLIPDDVVVVGESGLKSADNVRTMADIGVDAILVGEALVRAKDTESIVKSLVKAGRP